MTANIPVCLRAFDGFEDDVWNNTSHSELSQINADSERTCRVGQAGNAMHSECVGMVLLYILTAGNCSITDLESTPTRGLDRIVRRGPAPAATLAADMAQAKTTKRSLSSGLASMAAMVMGRSAWPRL